MVTRAQGLQRNRQCRPPGGSTVAGTHRHRVKADRVFALERHLDLLQVRVHGDVDTGDSAVADGAVLELDGHRLVGQLHQKPYQLRGAGRGGAPAGAARGAPPAAPAPLGGLCQRARCIAAQIRNNALPCGWWRNHSASVASRHASRTPANWGEPGGGHVTPALRAPNGTRESPPLLDCVSTAQSGCPSTQR